MYHQKKIGIFISHIFGDFQRDLCQGIIDTASEFGYITEIFSSTDGEDMSSCSLGEQSILDIPNYDEFSAVCFASGTYLLNSLRVNITETLRNRCSCPIIEVTQSAASFPYITLDNDQSAALLTEHMISTHHHRRVCYLGRSTEYNMENPLARNRFRRYVETMERHALPVHETDYCFCDDSYEAVEAALDHFLQTAPRPGAIICYNDRMALTLMETLCRRGLRIPEDIAVAGFDDLEISRNITPSLSTVTLPVYEMGQCAAKLLLDAIQGAPLPPRTAITAEPIYRASCGCRKKAPARNSLYENKLMAQIKSLERSMLGDIKMSSVLYSVRELEEGMNLLERFLPRIKNCHECYICLYQNWDAVAPHIQEIASAEDSADDTDLLIMPFAYRDGKRIHGCSFTKQSILPDYIYADSQSSYIYSPLYFEDRAFGYAAISYKDNLLSYQFDFLTWMGNVSRMLKNICEKKQTELLVRRLEDIYMKDELTGLYNRQGFRLLAEPLVTQAKQHGERLHITTFHPTQIEAIREQYGQEEGFFALRVLGHALTHVCTPGMIAARPAEDLFCVLCANDSSENVSKIGESVQSYLENYSRLSSKKYDINVTYKHTSFSAETIADVQDLLLS